MTLAVKNGQMLKLAVVFSHKNMDEISDLSNSHWTVAQLKIYGNKEVTVSQYLAQTVDWSINLFFLKYANWSYFFLVK